MLTRPARRPDLTVRYGDGISHVADVHLPPSGTSLPDEERPGYPLTLLLHGGFWRAEFGREHTAPLAEALASAGFVVCAPEYRRTGQEGGGWPGTFDDVAVAVDALPGLIARETGAVADPRRLVLAGHSAGGQLALWAASRHRLPAGSPWRAPTGAVRGVVALAAVTELAECYGQALGQQAAGALMGGGPDEVSERYRAADPIGLLPCGFPIRLVHGTADDRVPAAMSLHFARAARAAGDDVTCVLLPGTGHFEVIDPRTGAWASVLAAFRAMAR